MKAKRLKYIAHIITGYTFRSAIKNLSNGNEQVIQAKNIHDLKITNLGLDAVILNVANINALTQKNDIILSSRGRIRAGVVASSKQLVASSSVYIIRLTYSQINPYYLAIYINSIQGQRELSKIITGGSIHSLLKRNLKNLMIPLLPLSKQQQIVNLYINLENQKKLFAQKINFMSQIFEQVLKNKLCTK